MCGRCSVPIQHHLSALPLSTPPHLPSPRTMSGHSKVSSNLAGLTTLLHLPTDSKLTPKSISKECKEKTDKNRKSYQEDKRPLGRSQGRLGLQFTNPGTLQLLKDLLIAPMVTGRIASSLSTEPLGTPPPTRPQLPTPLQTAIGNLGPAETGRGVESAWRWGQGFPVTSPATAHSPSSQERCSGEAPDRRSFNSSHPVGTLHALDSH